MSQGSSRTYTSSIWRWCADAPGKSVSNPSPRALADLARRKAMADTRDLTGRLLGDPPPGQSALDRKLEAERRAAEQSAKESNDG